MEFFFFPIKLSILNHLNNMMKLFIYLCRLRLMGNTMNSKTSCLLLPLRKAVTNGFISSIKDFIPRVPFIDSNLCLYRITCLLYWYGSQSVCLSIKSLPGYFSMIELTLGICSSEDSWIFLAAVIAFYVISMYWKIGNICFSLANSAPGFGIIFR
jgi:hypothetical protein